MPIYEYECRKCGHAFDVLQKVDDRALRKCPDCGALQLQRLVSAPQFRLKGTGWYETDFKKDGKRRLAESGDGKAAGDATEAGKGEKTDKADKGEKTDKPAKADKDKKESKQGPAKPAAAAAD